MNGDVDRKNETFIEWISKFIPDSFYDWYNAKLASESDSASNKTKEEKMEDVVKQLQCIFDHKKRGEDIEDEWQLLEEQFDGLDLESSWISIQCNPDEPGEEEQETVTWFGNVGGVLPYITFIKPSSWTSSASPSISSSSAPSTPQVENIESRLQRQADELQMMRNQLEMLSKSLTMSQISSSGTFSGGFPSLYSSTLSLDSNASGIKIEEKEEKEEEQEEENVGLPPPPPPPLPGQLPQIKAMGTILLKPKIHIKTRKEIESDLESLINDSDLLDLNKPKAVANFLRSFPEKSEKHAKLLEKLVTDYPFLIKRFPLQPKTCYKRYQLWEEHLFGKIDDETSSVKTQTLRKKKTIEIEKLASSTEILAEIKNIFAFLEAEKRKEIEKEKAKKLINLQSSMVSELQGKLQQVAMKENVQKAELEMSIIESEEILL
eukprot:TRINITY_DN2394_c0_g2_i1.p1 TRINITY_DN2394_c0_g2~~TRINITY_DN2394_c0_g2_i1.p1  ORF type:complete len:460 (+),score=206.00 TRINITY_DN2394_c0_g2_i1:80-1381(+)